MKFTNWLYNYLSAHRYYMGNFNLWADLCVKLWYWLFKERINNENQIRKLKIKLFEARKEAEYIANVLRVTEKGGELTLNEALQLTGIISYTNDREDNYYDWDETSYPNYLLSLSDEEFELHIKN